MKKIMKKVMVFVLAVSLCVGSFMATNWNTASAEETSTDGLKVIGASIRFINEDTAVDGIRFAVGIKADAYDAETQNYHLLVMPTALLTDGELTKGDTYEYTVGNETKYAYAQDITIDWANATDETIGDVAYKVVRIYLNQINASYYTTGVTARAYYQDGTNAPVYADAIERSYYSVAEKALDDVSATMVEGKYDNAAGSKFSPYDATQRDALLGVKYEKTGIWDYQDGNLITNGSTTTPEGTKIHPMVLDREVATTSKSYIIETSYRVGYDDNTSYEEAATEIDNGSKGIIFGYNEDTGSYYVLDIRYRVHASLGRGFWAHIRYYNGTGWDGNVISHTVALEPGMYDFRITVDAETEGETVVYVEAKKPDESSYATLFPSTANPNNTWKNGRTITGTRVGFTSQLEDERLVFDPEIKVYNGGVQTRGNETLPVDTTLNITGEATTIEGSFVYDYRTCTTNSCANVRQEGIVLGDAEGTGYFFNICHHSPRAAFFISLKKGSTSTGTWGDVITGAGFNDLPELRKASDKGLSLSDNDEILVEYKIVVTKNASNQNVFTIDYSLNYGDTVIYEKTGWECVDTNATQTTITNLYLRSQDGGSPIKDTAVNSHYCGDGKTIYYPITIDSKTEDSDTPGGEEENTTIVTNQETVKLDDTLNITEWATTIEGSFVYDYRNCDNAGCVNIRREGILLGDVSGAGYFFCICDHMTYSSGGNFFVSLKKGSNGNWSDVNTGAGFNDLPKRSLVTDKGLNLSDNDSIVVKYKIVVTKNASNQNVFTIDYSLNYGDTVIYEKTGWECVDKSETQTTITNLYLRSEDGGSPIKDTAVNSHTCGDGQTIYYPVTISVEPEVDSTVTISNQGTIEVNKALRITAEPTTIEGSFVYDYRTCTYGGCANVRLEGIVFGDAEGTGYFFNICNHATRSAFFISLKKGSTSTGSWSDVITGAGFNDLPLWSNASDKGLNLSDNDPILVEYKIVVTKNASNQNVFVIDYSLNCGDTVIYEKTGWECVDTNATQTTITNLYLRSEDGGSPIKDTAVNNHTCGDGQTIYYTIKVNGVKVKVITE